MYVLHDNIELIHMLKQCWGVLVLASEPSVGLSDFSHEEGWSGPRPRVPLGRDVSVAMCQLPLVSGMFSSVPLTRGVLSLTWPSESTNTLVSGSVLSLTTERRSPCAGCASSGRNMWICSTCRQSCYPSSNTCSNELPSTVACSAVH